jgi:tetratricopeptide (TPR) repeat protein
MRAPLFGRQAELRDIEAVYERVIAGGRPQAISIAGAAGIGKSRLVTEALARVRERAGAVPPRVVRAAARPQAGAYDVLGRLLRTRFEIPPGLDDESARERLRARVSELLEDRKVGDVLYFLGGLVDVQFPGSPLVDAIEDDPQQLKLLRRAVVRRIFEADAASPETRGLLTIVVEDVHNASDDTLELLEYLAAHVQGPALILVTARPELASRRAGWGAVPKERRTQIALGALSSLDAERLTEALLAPVLVPVPGEPVRHEVPAELVESVVELAGGNPALLERTVRILHDHGVLTAEEVPTDEAFVTRERWRVDLERLADVHLPMTVLDAVSARLAALGPEERNLLEKAAAMGAVFWLGGLVALGRLNAATPELWNEDALDDADRLRRILHDLVERDYVLPIPDSSFPGEQEYVFKHNLEREAVERLIPSYTARRYHQTVADWLDFRSGVRSHEEHIASLAFHREKAGARSRAAHTWIEAGDIARSRYANAKAAEFYQRGLELLGDDDARERLEALHHYGDVLLHLGQNEGSLLCFRDMLALAFRLDLQSKGGAAHNRIGRLFRDSGRLDEASTHLEAGLALFEQVGDARGIASSLDDLGKLAWLRGDYPRALELLREALQARKRLGDRRSIALSLHNLGLVLQDSGSFKEALDAFEQALRIRREIGDQLGVALTLNNLGTIAQDQRDDARAMKLYEEAFAIAREVGDRQKMAICLTNIGETHYRLGNVERAIETLTESAKLAEELGDQLVTAESARGLGKAYLIAGDLPRAREHTARALQLFEQVRSRFQIGVALRTLGEVTAAGGWGVDDVSKAKEYFERAIALFTEIGNEIELARTFRSYSEFLSNAVELRDDARIKAEVIELRRRADDVSAKLKISAIGLDPGAFFKGKKPEGER